MVDSCSLLKTLNEQYLMILSLETESKRKELTSIDENIYHTKLQLSKLRLMLLAEQETTHFNNNSHTQNQSPYALTNGVESLSQAPPTTTTPPVITAGTSWIEFEKQFLETWSKKEESEEEESSMDLSASNEWSVIEASELLSMDTTLSCDNASMSCDNASMSCDNASMSCEVSTMSCDNAIASPDFSTVSCDSNRPIEDSRFYVKRQIIVGNTSLYLKKGTRVTGDRSTHKWMVYLRSGASEPPLHTFVKSVTFFLHPSYAPNDIVVLIRPPYQLTRFGWGEFPVRVQLHFIDSAHKPTDILHHLKLDHVHTGQQMLGGETSVNIELVKGDHTCSSEIATLSDNNDIIDENEPLSSKSTTKDSNNTSGNVTSNTANTCDIALWEILQAFARRMPLYGNGSVCYGASSLEEFNRWNIVKQRAVEWMRAVDIKRLIRNTKVPHANEMTTTEIVNRCRIIGHTPRPLPMTTGIGIYCKQCGKQLDQRNNCNCTFVTTTTRMPLSGTRDIMTVLGGHSEIEFQQECSSIGDNSSDPTQYRVPKSPELKWVHQTCLELDLKLFPQFHDGMLLHVTDHMIFSATSQFVYQLLKSVVTMETETFDWSNERVIVPNLIYEAIKNNDEFDFLTDTGLNML